MQTPNSPQNPFTGLQQPSTSQGVPFSAGYVYSQGTIPPVRFRTTRANKTIRRLPV